MTSETVYVWFYPLAKTEPIVCGRLTVEGATSNSQVGAFVYGQSYLSSSNPLPIDPETLPLSATREYTITTFRGVFPAFLDAAPDAWGRRIIDREFGPQTEVGYLLKSAGDHVGALAFSPSATQPPGGFTGFAYPDIKALVEASRLLELNQAIPDEFSLLLKHGSSPGGARPKATIAKDGSLWLAKFPSIKDDPALPPHAVIEAATLDLAEVCGLDVPQRELVKIGNRDVLLVKRFDRPKAPNGKWSRLRFLSGRTVFAAANPHGTFGSYPRLARQLDRWSVSAANDRRELFTRLVFNCLVSNTDDHDLNHGLLDPGDGHLQLSPAFDIVPQPSSTRRRQHAMLIGELGALGTAGNVLSSSAAFGIARGEALDIISQLRHEIGANWRRFFLERGADARLDRLSSCFCPEGFDDESAKRATEVAREIFATPQPTEPKPPSSKPK
jgi:serine/threonine-protein kinase HipA